MQDAIADILILPMPVLWLLLLGIILWRWKRLSRAAFLVGILLFLAISLPASGKLLLSGLRSGAPPLGDEVPEGVAGILVPSGGTFDDGAGRWWPSRSSLKRLNAALRLRQRTGLPIILSGGSPLADQPPEAETLAESLGLTGEQVRLETTARNSSETAEAVAALLAGVPKPRVILVTSATHVARMSAALRHHGIEVAAAVVAGDGVTAWAPGDILPSYRGLKMSQRALREYLGIAWYLVTDRLDLEDL